MADPIAIACLAGECFQALSTLLSTFTADAKRDAALQSSLANIQICYDKVKAFSTTWGYTDSEQGDASADQVLWDESSSLRVEDILNRILGTENEILTLLSKAEIKPGRSLLRRCVFWSHQPSNGYDMTKLDDLISTLAKNVDAGWAYYHAAAESKELQASHLEGSFFPIPDDGAAQQAKEVSVALYDILCTSDDDHYRLRSVDLNLSDQSLSKQRTLPNSSLPPLSFRLFFQHPENSDTWKHIMITGVDKPQSTKPNKLYQENSDSDQATDLLGFVHVNKEDVISSEAGKISHEDYFRKIVDSETGEIFERLQPGLQELVFLKVTESLTPIAPSPHVVPVSDLLNPRRKSNSSALDNAMPLVERVNLAYRIVKYGFYTLGTPWASFLRLENIQRISGMDIGPRYVLNITDSMHYSSDFNDPSTLAETSHLLQIGILLIEIGLQRASSMLEMEASRNWSDRIETLAEVEREMGSQYCRAAAFCLQPRHDLVQSQMREKFDYNVNEPWRNYSSEILGEYYKHVLKRLKNVRNELKAGGQWSIQ